METDVYSQYCEVPGKIVDIPIQLGQQVRKGDVIAIIDDSNEKYLLEQLRFGLDKKKAVLADLQNAIDPAEINQAQNNVVLAEQSSQSAKLTLEQAQKNFENIQGLFEGGGISQSARDDAKYQLDQASLAFSSAALQVDNTRQRLVLLQKGPDQEKIAAAQADVEQTESQIRQSEANLAKYKIVALSDGIVISRNYLIGDMVNMGANLVDIASQQDKYLVAYVPVDSANLIDYGQELAIFKGKNEYKGTVSFIDLEAKYTPKDMQTSANKNKDSIKIKIKLAADNPLKPGEMAELILTWAECPRGASMLIFNTSGHCCDKDYPH